MNKLTMFNDFPADALFAWYDVHGRQLPWRAFSPKLAPAYHVFLSELMLQQTGVSTVIPYFTEFVARWPDLHKLAAADEDEVLAAWAGLGYYARARNMLKAAKMLVQHYKGEFPKDTETLQSLPGIGHYTAGAISAIAFAQPAVVLDGNIERVLTRYAGFDQEIRVLKPILRQAYTQIRPSYRLSDFPQALMDIGAMTCQPRKTDCQTCPLQSGCAASRMDVPTKLPIRPVKKPKAVRRGTAFVIRNARGQTLLVKRPEKGLLGGMVALPSYGWDGSARPEWLDDDTLISSWSETKAEIKHVFTHFTAEIQVYSAKAERTVQPPEGYFWQECKPENLPTLMAKCVQAILMR